MPDPFLGEIRMFGGNFPPRDWAFCDGQLLPIAQNTALFSLLGTSYGGDGRTTFGLPDLRGRAPLHWGNGPGVDQVNLGEKSGANDVTLSSGQMPAHSHPLNAASAVGDASSPSGALPATVEDSTNATLNAYGTGAADVTMDTSAVGSTGGTTPVSLMQPYLGISFIIALQGTFPSRS